MFHLCVYENGALREGEVALIDAPGLKWIDIESADLPTMSHLAERFGLHRLAIEDCLHLDQRPKLEEYPGHQFIVLQGFTSSSETIGDLEVHELHLFLGKDWVISVHEKPHAAIASVRKRVLADPAATIGRGADFVAYLLTDALVDSNFPLLDRFNDSVESLEERIFTERPSCALMHRAFDLKRKLVLLRRVLSPQRDVVGLLARSGIAQVNERTTLYFRDVYDHLVRIYEQIEAARDLVGNAVDAYLSVVANRTSDISKQLTIFASIFMPLSFVVGFFGQNFDQLVAPPFFIAMVTLMIAIPVAMIWWFNRKDWL